MPTVCVDWDDTLVGYKKYGEPGEWLPGATLALRKFKRAGFTVVIHSCRALWPEGRAEIEGKLREANLRLGSRLKIHDELGKPLAVAYIDDRGVRFDGDWSELNVEGMIRALR